LERYVAHPLGSLERPMSDADLDAKFRELTREVLAPSQSDELAALCWDLPALPDAGAIVRAAAA
jgi:2-methylcitrate dehydratase PrpD